MEKYRCAILSESNKIYQRMILGYLKDSGYYVDIFHDQALAIGSIGECKYNLLLVDIDMPELDVISLISHTQHICPETSIVIITGNDKLDTAMQTLKLGALDILVQPINLFYLDAVLEKSIQLGKMIMDHSRALEDIKEAQVAIAELKRKNLQLLKENESLRAKIQLLNH